MGILAKDNRQLIFIYSEGSIHSNRILPYVQSMDKAVRLININEEGLSDSIWIELAAILQVNIQELFDNNSSKDFSDFGSYSVGDWLKIINHKPQLLKNPIAINGSKAEIIKEQHNIFSFYNTIGSNFNKAPKAIKMAKHKDTTKLEA